MLKFFIEQNNSDGMCLLYLACCYSKVSDVIHIIYLAFSWLAKANLAAFSCSLANLFSYLETFFRVGLMNFPFMPLTELVSSLIWRSRRMTSRCRKNISASSLYHLSKYCWQIFFKSSTDAFSMSALVPQRSAMTRSLSSALRSCSFFSSSAAFLRRRVRSFFLRSGVINPFFLAMMRLSWDPVSQPPLGFALLLLLQLLG